MLPKSLKARAANLDCRFFQGFRMQKPAEKAHLYKADPHALDGYPVLMSLICIVAAITCAIIVTFGIEALT